MSERGSVQQDRPTPPAAATGTEIRITSGRTKLSNRIAITRNTITSATIRLIWIAFQVWLSWSAVPETLRRISLGSPCSSSAATTSFSSNLDRRFQRQGVRWADLQRDGAQPFAVADLGRPGGHASPRPRPRPARSGPRGDHRKIAHILRARRVADGWSPLSVRSIRSVAHGDLGHAQPVVEGINRGGQALSWSTPRQQGADGRGSAGPPARPVRAPEWDGTGGPRSVAAAARSMPAARPATPRMSSRS